MAVCDSKYRILYCHLGSFGSESDAGIFDRSDFKQALLDGTLHIPNPAPLPNTEIISPYFFVGDSAFPLMPNLMKPLSGDRLSQVERIYNYRISRGRRVIENVFGILAAKWRVLLKPIETNIENADQIIKAIIALHNFIIDENDQLGPANLADFGFWNIGFSGSATRTMVNGVTRFSNPWSRLLNCAELVKTIQLLRPKESDQI